MEGRDNSIMSLAMGSPLSYTIPALQRLRYWRVRPTRTFPRPCDEPASRTLAHRSGLFSTMSVDCRIWELQLPPPHFPVRAFPTQGARARVNSHLLCRSTVQKSLSQLSVRFVGKSAVRFRMDAVDEVVPHTCVHVYLEASELCDSGHPIRS
jgi:hypothetical protein